MYQEGLFSDRKSVGSLYPQWCRLIRDRRWSSSQKRELIESFGDPLSVLNAPIEQLRIRVTGKQRNLSSLVKESDIQSDLAWLNCAGHHLIPFTDQSYPELLHQLSDPPLALFAIGNVQLLKEPQVAIVGSRRPTPVGDKVARLISRGLVDIGVVVTSGMAFGVDGAAHQASINAGGGSIAVLGNGVDIVYPSRHRVLYENLVANGLLVSEYPLGMKPSRYTFPKRNRIISGLSYGVVIVEAAERSGTLITARLAMEQNREVMVVPGSALSAQYHGSHQLLRQGAALVSSIEDVVQCLSEPLSTFLKTNGQSVKSEEVDVEHTLLEHISVSPTSIDDIILASGLTSAEVSSMLLELELIGAVAVADDGGYVNLS